MIATIALAAALATAPTSAPAPVEPAPVAVEAPAPVETPSPDPAPSEPAYTPPVLHCEPWQVPGWLNEHGDPTSCVNNSPNPGEEPATEAPTPAGPTPSPAPSSATPAPSAPATPSAPSAESGSSSPTTVPASSTGATPTELAYTGTADGDRARLLAIAAALVALGALILRARRAFQA
jgi:hypothetical protein